jgi:predicted acetyltransferase
MNSQLEYRPLSNSQETQQLETIIRQCFGSSHEEWEHYLNSIGSENFRLLREGNDAIAGLAIYLMGQWYGGQCVPMAGIAAVGVAPEHRGKGGAYQLMKRTIEELYDLEVPISALFPATQILYRKVGYEQAGSHCRWELPVNNLRLQDRQLPIKKIELSDRPFLEKIYHQQAQLNNGNLARHAAIWQRITESAKETAYAYLIGSESDPEGYLIFTQKQAEAKTTMEIRDWVILTPKAAQRLWTFIADHRSQINEVHWQGSLLNPFLMLLPEQTAKITRQMMWMLRIINAPLALSKRGYPTGLEAELHLELQDNVLAVNNGKFYLKVSNGRGEVIQGGRGNFQINIRGLASLYTGLMTAEQLQQIGYLNTTPEGLKTANLLFSGTHPWLADFF